MAQEFQFSFWQRFAKSFGLAGVVAFLLVYFAASLGGRFDWQVFGICFIALAICWVQTWVLLPIQMRSAIDDNHSWERYWETHWRFVNSLSEMSGTEIDNLRALFRMCNDAEAHAKIGNLFPVFDKEETEEFMRFFNEQIMDTESVYIDEDGRLQPMD